MELRDRLQSTLGNAYSVERELGGGGMSRVFLARETALGRNVVVKMLGEDLVAGLSSERFAREVKLAASLQHPNIVPVLITGVADGIPYYTMPYVKGESLRARMKTGSIPRRQIISILRDLARALQYAHGEGVIHRDIKPENILLSGDAAVVTDFGIAKAISAARSSTAADRVESQSGYTLTQAGSAVGTPAYMAPEQVAGDTLDHRADIYAWGLIAYELLAGVHPFSGRESAAQLMAAHLSQSPPPLADQVRDAPRPLVDLVMRCLSKDPGQRPPSASALLESLDDAYESREHVPATASIRRRPRTAVLAGMVISGFLLGSLAYYRKGHEGEAATAATRAVAVLPFAHDRADSTEAYFGEGIADELMTALGKVPGIRVASRTSAIAVGKRDDLDVREIGRQLGVSAVVEGTVRRAGGQLRVTAQLTNASDGLAMWSDVYERDNKDVFAVQNDITQAIVAALRPELAAGENNSGKRPASGAGTSDPEAYDLYLRGLYLIERRDVGRASEYFQQAIAKDDRFARAYAGLASALVFFPYFLGVPARNVEARVQAAAHQSLRLDPTLGEPRVALAMAHWHAYRWKEAEEEFKRALAADSTSAVAHTQYGRYLQSIGQAEPAIREFRIARRLDPLSPTASVWLSHSLGYIGDFPAAIEEGKRARELDPNLWNSRTVPGFNLVTMRRFDEAIKALGENDDASMGFAGQRAFILELAGAKERAATIRKRLDALPDSTWFVHGTRVYAYLPIDTAKALSEMELSIARHEILPHAVPLFDRVYDGVRKSARFAAIVRKAGLEGRGITGPNGGRPSP